jgi:hypothetical protein
MSLVQRNIHLTQPYLLLREVQALLKAQGHPSVCQFFESWINNGDAFILMDARLGEICMQDSKYVYTSQFV